MPQAANPFGSLRLYTPGPDDPHTQPHPYVVYPDPLKSGFDLIASPAGDYELSFGNDMLPTANNNHATGCVYLSAFADTATNPIATRTVMLPPNHDRMFSSATIGLSVAQVAGATQIWAGSWWDDGTYADSRDGVIAYFRDHPEGGTHHTVPIRIA